MFALATAQPQLLVKSLVKDAPNTVFKFPQSHLQVHRALSAAEFAALTKTFKPPNRLPCKSLIMFSDKTFSQNTQ